MRLLILICNRLSKSLGNLSKVFLCYPFHFLFPKKRFTIPEYSKAIFKGKSQTIPKKIWQTNYSNRVSLSVYLNYLFNRLLSLSYDYHYVSTENRLIFVENNASEEIFTAYKRLNDGAAQADFWRLLVLQHFGGVYIDIDAHLVFPLSGLVKKTDQELFIIKGENNSHTNYFIAINKHHPILIRAIEIILSNINSNKAIGVFALTGPVPFSDAIEQVGTFINAKSYRYVCVQGSFTNEYFQYIDKPNGKWIHTKPSDVLK
ncbi:Mannosyltransferase OCH1 and related enzymes [uncultured Candidatus Thioglobus sp.]|nr:Mannosyltransferase OCH1 and related enzymes [uncultured Candidatus Thioglobus sp.]